MRANARKPAQCHPSELAYVRGNCEKCYAAEYREKNRDKVRAGQRQWSAVNADKLRMWRREHYVMTKERTLSVNQRWYQSKGLWLRRAQHYGISKDAWMALYDAQGGTCRICCDAITVSRAATDHDHATGKIRGLLCSRCNSMLGHGRDRTEILASAIRYLEETR